MSDLDGSGVYGFEDGKSGIARMAPPEWWLPKIDRTLLKSLMKRNNYLAFISHGGWFLLVIGLGYLSARTFGSPWCILWFFLYGTVLSTCNARWHESLHGTPFRTSFLNEIMYFIGATLEFRDVVYTRWSHMTHHSYTVYPDVDLKFAALRPVRLWKMLPDLFYITSTILLVRQQVIHSLGILTPNARKTVPESDYVKMFWAARVTLLVHLVPVALSIILHSWIPVLLVTFPRMYGGILVYILIMTQHAGLAENVPDHRLSTRTVILNPIFSFLYMHMEYHVEHHMFPLVPFHSLARLHKAIAGQTPKPYRGLWQVYRVLLPVLWRQRRDVSCYIERELPGEA